MPAIKKPNLHFDVATWTGTNTAAAVTISSLNFQPDLVWGKSRTSSYTHGIHDSVRGTAAGRLESNATTAEVAPGSFGYGSVSAFNSNGFTASPGSSTNENWNETGSNLVAWTWKAGGAAVTNNDGTITSQVSANPTAGFSVVTYSANGSTGTVGHGLGVAPRMIIVKKRNAVERWCVFHTSTSNAYLYLNETNAAETGNANLRFGNNSSVVQPSSTVFTIGSANDVNGTSGTYVAYCFASIAGYSAFGNYVGNSSSDGPFIYTGFRPRWIMLKVASGQTGDWLIIDTSRDTYNVASNLLYANSTAAQDSPGGYTVDLVSNGFKLRHSSFGFNNSSGTYIYAAFAEAPFKFTSAR